MRACSRVIWLKRRKFLYFFCSLSSLGFLAIVSWVVKFEWILARHANQSSSSFAYSSTLNFLPQARTHEFTHAPRHAACHGIVVVAVVRAIVQEQCLHQL
jgi:hypothetical protein